MDIIFETSILYTCIVVCERPKGLMVSMLIFLVS